MVSWWREVAKLTAKNILVVEEMDSKADANTIEMRQHICSICPNNIDGICNICKCFIDLKVKTKVNRKLDGTKEITHCPEGRWNDKNIVEFYKTRKDGKEKIES